MIKILIEHYVRDIDAAITDAAIRYAATLIDIRYVAFFSHNINSSTPSFHTLSPCHAYATPVTLLPLC